MRTVPRPTPEQPEGHEPRTSPRARNEAKPRETVPERGESARPDEAEEVGLQCRTCGCRHFEVIYTRPLLRGGIRRRRECRHCGRRITTVEREGAA